MEEPRPASLRVVAGDGLEGIGHDIVILGDAPRVPDDRTLWIFNEDIDADVYHPLSRVDPGEPFELGTRIGNEELGDAEYGEEYVFLLVSVGPEAAAELDEYLETAESSSYPGFESLPDGVVVLQAESVLRTR